MISPALLNIALHGMGKAAGVRYQTLGSDAAILARDSPVLVVYADDLLALCHSQEQAEQVKARLAAWLAPRGLAFNEDKTRIVHLDEGCDFLGFNIRRYRGKLLTKPSNAALRRIRERLAAEVLALRGANADAVIAKLNPIIKGWAAYYRIGVSKRAFNSLDAYVWRLVYKWAKFSHPNKSKRWVTARYFGMFNPFRQDRWVFGDRDQRLLPLQVRLDADRPAPDGARNGVDRRSRPGRLLGQAAPPRQTPAGQRHPASAAEAGRPMPALRRAAAARRPRAAKPPTSGNSGSRSPAQRSANTRSPPMRATASRTNPPPHASYTPTATVG